MVKKGEREGGLAYGMRIGMKRREEERRGEERREEKRREEKGRGEKGRGEEGRGGGGCRCLSLLCVCLEDTDRS
jgi:hypothetical protein